MHKCTFNSDFVIIDNGEGALFKRGILLGHSEYQRYCRKERIKIFYGKHDQCTTWRHFD